MRAVLLHGVGDVRVDDVPDPIVRRPTDAVVRVVAAAICGSDLWSYRGIVPFRGVRRIGHEFVGVVEDVGPDVRTIERGDFVIAPFVVSDGECVHCRNGVHTSCTQGAYWGGSDADGELIDGAQGEAVRVPLADGTLISVETCVEKSAVPHLLTLADVLPTGHHAAISAGVGPGATVAVVGDGAVGLCAVIASRRLGAERIVLKSRRRERQHVAAGLGATDFVAERGAEGAERLRDLLGGIGADAVLECVGTKESMEQAIASVRPGGRIGYVGVPDGGAELPMRALFDANVTVGGGLAPVRAYVEDLLPGVVAGSIRPGDVFDLELPLGEAARGYEAMDRRRATKALLRP